MLKLYSNTKQTSLEKRYVMSYVNVPLDGVVLFMHGCKTRYISILSLLLSFKRFIKN